ncbi:MAG: orotidine-5'-phosphate decarboxylase [Polyangiaceae bacterium]
MSRPELTARERLAFALDYPGLEQARRGAIEVAPHAGVLKVGLELFIRAGADAVNLGREHGARVFLDLKLHDIPETVARAVDSALELGVSYLTVHAQGGTRMLSEAAKRTAGTELTLLAVTVLTSLDDADLQSLGVTASSSDHALRLARLAYDAGVRGFVCSSAEVGRLREALGTDALFVTPGIRPENAAAGDQKRVGTPRQAIAAGADILVVGRPIRDAESPATAAAALQREIAEATRVAQ